MSTNLMNKSQLIGFPEFEFCWKFRFWKKNYTKKRERERDTHTKRETKFDFNRSRRLIRIDCQSIYITPKSPKIIIMEIQPLSW